MHLKQDLGCAVSFLVIPCCHLGALLMWWLCLGEKKRSMATIRSWSFRGPWPLGCDTYKAFLLVREEGE